MCQGGHPVRSTHDATDMTAQRSANSDDTGFSVMTLTSRSAIVAVVVARSDSEACRELGREGAYFL